MRRKNNAGSVLFLLFMIALIGGVVYIYNSETFERVPPKISIADEIHWNLKQPIAMRIEDTSGIRKYKVVLLSESEERILSSETFDMPLQHTTVEINVTYPKIGGYLKSSSTVLVVEAIDGSKWDFFSGNKVVAKRQVIIDQRKPVVSTIANSFGITRGGAALVVFQAKDNHLDQLYIETNFGKKFIPQPFYKEGYYISLVAWPITEKSFRATVVALDKAGNTARASIQFEERNKRYKVSKIQLKENFLEGKIAELAAEFEQTVSITDGVEQFTAINETVREANEALIHQVTSQVPTNTVSGFNMTPFYPLANAKAVASFGDYRKYYYHGKEISRSYHLGIDLASVAGAEIKTQNSGQVVFAQHNGIYGNVPIIHHGMGLYTLYGHCSSMQVEERVEVASGDVIAHSGKSGLALGDHLHFGVLVQGIEVRPAEWMDRAWIKLNITDIIQTAKGIIDRS